MSQYSREPEYTVEEPEETQGMVRLRSYTSRDLEQVVVEVKQLLAESTKALGMLDDITAHLLVLEQSLQEQG